MLGHSHALSGVLAGAAAGTWALNLPPAPLALLAATTAGYALVPDLDHCGSTMAREGGFLTETFAWCVRAASGGHRHGTHSLAGAAVFTAATYAACEFRGTWPGRIVLGVFLAIAFAGALRALRLGGHFADTLAVAGAVTVVWSGYGLTLVPAAAALGTAVHLAGDMLTDEGVPLLWPFTRRHYRLLPEPFAFTTGTRPERWIVAPALIVALAAVTLAACRPLARSSPPPQSRQASGTSQDPAGTTTPPDTPWPSQPLRHVHDPGEMTGIEPASCHFRGGGQLPDPGCTPGSIDPAVTQANIRSTVCRTGYTMTVRPPESQTEHFKSDEAYPAYGVADGTRTELDHLVPLELGGSNDASNLWPEVPAAPNPKDTVEGALHDAVCSGEVTLSAAQDAIASNWMMAESRLGISWRRTTMDGDNTIEKEGGDHRNRSLYAKAASRASLMPGSQPPSASCFLT